jgi:aldehyde dehydrogenase (NAD+)
MENTSGSVIASVIKSQRDYYSTHSTKNLAFRIDNLKKLRTVIQKFEDKISAALWADLHKSKEEVWLTEISLVLQEIDNHIRHLKQWAAPKRVKSPIQLWPSRSRILYEPLGIALVIAPWNYPVLLLLNPLVGAISAGCCALLKPSPHAPQTALVIADMLEETFSSSYIATVQGGRDVNQILLEHRFDMIFFTGSPALGKIVMKAAAEYLTPLVLELGGKNPCIVDEEADLTVAARRIALGKFLNAGQTCIAPDYLFVHRSVKDQLLEKIIVSIGDMYGHDPMQSGYFPRIVNRQAVERLEILMQHGTIKYGGVVDRDRKYISPTIIDEVKPDFPIMQEEIFGPLLPVMSFDKLDEVIAFINGNEKPLALYYFGNSRKAGEVMMKTTSGGGCINDTLMYIANHHLPFGGVGNSGMNKYHGMESFLAFSNVRSLVISPAWIDLSFKYPPFKYFKQIKKIL